MPAFQSLCLPSLLFCAHRLPFYLHRAFRSQLPHRKRDQKGHLPGLQRPAGAGARQALSRGWPVRAAVWTVSAKTREFGEQLLGAVCWGVQTAQGRGGGVSQENVRNAPCGSGLLGPSALLPQETNPCSENPFRQAEPLSSLVTLRPLLCHIPP